MSAHEPVGPVDASLVPRYAGLSTFARLPRREDVPGADVAVVGVPFDSGVSYRPGARFGPAHIRQSSRLLRPFNPALGVSPFADKQVVDAGDIAVNPFDIARGDRPRSRPPRASSSRGRPAAHPGRRPHHRAAAAARAARPARAARRAALRCAPRHLGHLLRRAVHARHTVPPRGRGGAARPASTACTSASAARCTARATCRRRPTSASPPSTPPSWRRSASPARSSGCGSASATGRSTSSVDIDVLDPAHAPGTGTPEAGGPDAPGNCSAVLRALAGLRRRRRRRRRGRAGLRPRRDHRHRRRARRLRTAVDLRSTSTRAQSLTVRSRVTVMTTTRPPPASPASRSARSTTSRSTSGTASCGTSVRCGSCRTRRSPRSPSG